MLGIGLLAAAGACARRSDGDIGVGEAAGEAPQDLSGELLSLDDLDGEWDTGGPEEIDVSDLGGEVTGPCPGGQTVALRDMQRNQAAPGNATIRFESADLTGVVLVEELSHDPTGELFEAFRQVFDACVGEEWEQGNDPVENVKFETIDLGDHGDDAVGYRQLWGSGGEYYGQDQFAVVRVGDVALSLYVTEENTDDPLDGDVLPEALAAAVAHLEDGEWATAVDEPGAPELDEPASVTVEMDDGEWGLVVRGNGGCRFRDQENESIGIFEEEEIPDWDLAPNVEWLAQQIFAVYADVSLTVSADRVDVTLYKENQGGANAIGVDRETAEHAADDLRERLGNRAVCGIESPSTTATIESRSTDETARGLFVEDLRVGDCFNDSGLDTPEVGEITRVDCGSPHDAEVLGRPTLSGAPGAPYPGDDEIDRASDEVCLREFATYVGIDFQESMWEFGSYLPTEETWSKYDDRLVVCYLNDPSFVKLEGSKRGSNT